MTKAVLIDTTRCTACRGCQVACKQWNDLPAEKTTNLGTYQNPLRLSASTWTLVQMREVEYNGKFYWTFLKRQCMQCLHPACVSACPVGAMYRSPEGLVLYDASRCIGCRYCMTACPFRIPRFEWDQPLSYIRKCNFCADRQAEGLLPACVKTCPTGALAFGERDEMIALAKTRIGKQPEKYIHHVYGEEEGGGTSWLVLSAVPFEYLGLPSLQKEPVAQLNDDLAHYGTPGLAVGVAAILAGLQWYTRRRARRPEAAVKPETPVEEEKQ